ncbi:MAG: ankyrin repeat domain-containing protein, partial [Acidobacteria bacterium]|nr:ankyrin repeat domain-containing protein [Acidobacteriota bacterium]
MQLSAGRLAIACVLWGVLSAPAAGASDAPLVEAARAGDVEAVRALLDGGADANAPAVDGATALHWAVHRDDAETVDLLLAAGADSMAANRYGGTPLRLGGTQADAPHVR